jgi:hypothetical protein
MQFINNLIGAMFRVVFMLAGLVFVAGLVMVALVALVLSMLWSLLTGRRHPISVVWTRFRQTQDAVWRASRRQGPAGGASAPTWDTNGTSAGAATRAANDDVVDVVDLSKNRFTPPKDD